MSLAVNDNGLLKGSHFAGRRGRGVIPKGRGGGDGGWWLVVGGSVMGEAGARLLL